MNTPLRAALTFLTGATTLLVAACTSASESAPPTTVSVKATPWVKALESGSSSASPPTSARAGNSTKALPAAGPSVMSSEPASSSLSDSDGVIYGPRPAGRSSDDDDKIDSAADVLTRYWTLADQIGANPGQEWESQIAAVSEAQASDNLRSTVSSLAKAGEHTTGRTRVEASVSRVEPALVTFMSCIDVSGTQVIDSSGKEIGLDDGPGQYLRIPATVLVGKYEAGRWLVSVLQIERDTTC